MHFATQIDALSYIVKGRETAPIAMYELTPDNATAANALCVQGDEPLALPLFEEGEGDYTQQIVTGETSLGYILTFFDSEGKTGHVFAYRQE